MVSRNVLPDAGSEVHPICRLFVVTILDLLPEKQALVYMAVLALAGAASLCSPGAVFKEHPSEELGTLLFAVLLGSVCVP